MQRGISMYVKEIKELTERIFQIFNNVQGDMVRLKTANWDSIFSPDFIIHFTNRDMNLGQFIEYNAALFTAFPDSHFTIDDMIAAEDKVITRYTLRGTHKNEYMGIPPTGKQIEVKGVSIDRFVEGKDVETWDFPDTLGAMMQIGAIPSASSKNSK
jgi:steroid delta-isomerase-like uncharacterized protein